MSKETTNQWLQEMFPYLNEQVYWKVGGNVFTPNGETVHNELAGIVSELMPLFQEYSDGFEKDRPFPKVIAYETIYNGHLDLIEFKNRMEFAINANESDLMAIMRELTIRIDTLHMEFSLDAGFYRFINGQILFPPTVSIPYKYCVIYMLCNALREIQECNSETRSIYFNRKTDIITNLKKIREHEPVKVRFDNQPFSELGVETLKYHGMTIDVGSLHLDSSGLPEVHYDIIRRMVNSDGFKAVLEMLPGALRSKVKGTKIPKEIDIMPTYIAYCRDSLFG